MNEEQDRPFRFLALPRELRDEIYKLCLSRSSVSTSKRIVKEPPCEERSEPKNDTTLSLFYTNK
jgi:hypothetical protein